MYLLLFLLILLLPLSFYLIGWTVHREMTIDDYFENRIHAGIVKFSGKGMVIKPWDYWKYEWFLHKNRLQRESKKVVNWDE